MMSQSITPKATRIATPRLVHWGTVQLFDAVVANKKGCADDGDGNLAGTARGNCQLKYQNGVPLLEIALFCVVSIQGSAEMSDSDGRPLLD